MKYSYYINRRARSITKQVNDWLLARGLDQVSCDDDVTKYDWCGVFAAQVSTISNGACRLELAEWVVDELIICDGFGQVGQVIIIRDRVGLREITPVINNVFYPRAKDIRNKHLENNKKFNEAKCCIDSILKNESMPEKRRIKLNQELYAARRVWITNSQNLCNEYRKLPSPSKKVKSLQFQRWWD